MTRLNRLYQLLISVPKDKPVEIPIEDRLWNPPSEEDETCVCPHCERFMTDVAWRRMNTQYCDDKRNWCLECFECYQRTQEFWQSQWDDYYSGVL